MTALSQSSEQLSKPHHSGYVPVNGIDMYYEVHGQGSPIVLLHGAYMTIEMNWGPFIPELAKNRQVIAVELQGHGHTPFSERSLSRATLARDVKGLLDHLNIERADVVGYSFGGSVAYQFAIQSPERLSKLVIISSTYKSNGWLPEVTDRFKQAKPEFFTNTPLQAGYEAVAPDKTDWTAFVEQMIASASTPYDLGDAHIAQISAPVLLIAGDHDGLDKVELIKTYQLLGGERSTDLGAMPKSQLAIVPGQGHVSLMMQRDTIMGYLNGFLK
jgi:pimeloyl-ACP methyl ester carboxylesterase